MGRFCGGPLGLLNALIVCVSIRMGWYCFSSWRLFDTAVGIIRYVSCEFGDRLLSVFIVACLF